MNKVASRSDEELVAEAIRLVGLGGRDVNAAEMWTAAIQKDGLYISLESPQRELVLAAARSLAPLG
jgi:hypothetical protein